MSEPGVDRDLAVRTLGMLVRSCTKSGHAAQIVTNESRGNCLGRSGCTPACRDMGDLLERWTAYIKALDGERPTQLALLEAM
jgi:hypothetical protein